MKKIINRILDWCASWLPAPKPIGLNIRSYDVTRLDIAMVAGGLLISTTAAFWYGHPIWFGIGVGLFGLMWIWMAEAPSPIIPMGDHDESGK
jgi:hypothetical protein